MTAERDVDHTVDAFYSSAAHSTPMPLATPTPVPAPAPTTVPVPTTVPAPAVPVPETVPAPAVGRDRPPSGPLRGLPPLAAPTTPRTPARRRAMSRDGRPAGTGTTGTTGAARPHRPGPVPPAAELAPTPAEIARLRAIAMGQADADFAIRGGVVLVPQTGELLRRDVLIAGRYIAAVTQPDMVGARRSLDAAGRYVLPAYVDARTSVERTLLAPGELARLVVPRGTVTVLTDPAQLEQAHGPQGRALVLGTGTPVRVLPRGPRVPVGVRPDDHLTAVAGPLPGTVPEIGVEGLSVSRAVPRQSGPPPGPSAADLPSVAGLPPVPVVSVVPLVSAAPVVPAAPGTSAAVLPGQHLPEAHPDAGLTSSDGGIVFTHLDDQVREEIRAGVDVVDAVRAATLTPARAFGLDHVLGLIAPAHLADLQIVRDLAASVPPDVVIAGGRIAAEHGRALFDNLDETPRWSLSSVRLPVGLYTGSFTSPCMHWGGRRDTELGIVDVAAAGTPTERPRVTRARIEPTLRDGVVVCDPSRDLLKTAVLDRAGRADRVRVGMVRGLGLTRGAIGATAVSAAGDMVIVGAGDADMLTAARALEGMGGGFVVVERGWVLAACPLPVAGLMSDAPWEAVLGQLAAVENAARELGCGLAAPLRTISQLGRELYVRP